jgi:hypothetical protein
MDKVTSVILTRHYTKLMAHALSIALAIGNIMRTRGKKW